MNGRQQVFTVPPVRFIVTMLFCKEIQPTNSKALIYIQK